MAETLQMPQLSNRKYTTVFTSQKTGGTGWSGVRMKLAVSERTKYFHQESLALIQWSLSIILIFFFFFFLN